MDPWEPRATSIDWQVAIGGIFILGTLVAAFIYRKREPILSFCIIGYWLLLASTSSIAPLFYVAADYRTYPSSPFFFLPLCLLALRFTPAIRRTLAVGAVAWCAATSVYLNTTWHDDVSLYGHSVTYGGGWLAYHNLAMATPDARARKLLLEKALERSPHYDMAMLNLGRTLVALGEKDAGLEWLDRVKAWNPGNPLVRYWYARTMMELGRKNDAAREADAAASLDVTNSRSALLAAQAWLAINDRDRAAHWLDVALKLEPNSSPDDFALGFALQRVGKDNEAIAVYERFLEQNPNHVQVRFNLGYALMKVNDCAAAIREFQRVLELEPGKAAAHLHIANCSKQAGDTVLAQTHLAAWERSQKNR
jgi:tetratricopeptide (TPR) repeat protein